eukprot:gene16558-22606_t
MDSFLLIWICVSSVVCFVADSTNVALSWHQLLQPDLINTHGFNMDEYAANPSRYDWKNVGNDQNDQRSHFICGHYDESISTEAQNTSINYWLVHPQSHSIFNDKSTGYHCLLAYISDQETREILKESTGTTISINPFPSILKIDHSIFEFVSMATNDFNKRKSFINKIFGIKTSKTIISDYSGMNDDSFRKSLNYDNTKQYRYLLNQKNTYSKKVEDEIQVLLESFILSIEFTSFSLNILSPRELSNDLLQKFEKVEKISIFENNLKSDHNKWESLLQSYFSSVDNSNSNILQVPACSNIKQLTSINYYRHSIELEDLSAFSINCIISLIHFAVASPNVLRISTFSRPILMNFEARGLLQGGRMNVEPYKMMGLTGEGQICGIADSGLNDLSCFFIDDSRLYPTVTTNRSGAIEWNRRKVIQYTAFADSCDEKGGHGTHVSGSVAGSSKELFSDMNGMAPDAKITFFDIGMTDKAFLKIPALYDILESAYTTGARVHTNSWGNLGGLYGQMSFDLDDFTFENPDMLVLFAGGNSGGDGLKSVISPGNSKNALTVGAAQ